MGACTIEQERSSTILHSHYASPRIQWLSNSSIGKQFFPSLYQPSNDQPAGELSWSRLYSHESVHVDNDITLQVPVLSPFTSLHHQWNERRGSRLDRSTESSHTRKAVRRCFEQRQFDGKPIREGVGLTHFCLIKRPAVVVWESRERYPNLADSFMP
jgi:hypothetical protein